MGQNDASCAHLLTKRGSFRGESEPMLQPNFCSQRGPFSYAELGERPSFL